AERARELTEARGRAPERVRREHGVTTKVQRVGQVLLEDAVDVAGPDAVGEQARDHRARAAADVDVESASLAVEPLLDGGQRTDLVHAPDDAATRESQPDATRGARAPAAHRTIDDAHLGHGRSKALAKGVTPGKVRAARSSL